MDLSFAFHLISLVAFVGLAWKWVCAQSDLRWAQSLWALSTQSERVYADWPEVFLSRWCRLIRVPYEGSGRSAEQRPTRLRPKMIIRFFAEHPVQAVRQEEAGFLFTLASACEPHWESTLRQALGDRSSVRFHVLNKESSL